MLGGPYENRDILLFMKLSKISSLLILLIMLLIVAVAALGVMRSFVETSAKQENHALHDFQDFQTQPFVFSGKVFELALADDVDERAQGLSLVKHMNKNQGMLFVFEEAGIYKFWMKDMQFPLDIIWFDAHGVVVHVEENLSPETYPKSFGPDSNALYVLEMNVGFVDEYNVQLGQKVF